MKKRGFYNNLSNTLALIAVLLMFCIAGGLDTDSLTIKNAIILALLDFNLFGVAVVFSAKGGDCSRCR